jgi:hypothetical protein
VSGRRPAAEIILEHLRNVYRPAFRRGDRLWSAALAGEVRRSEALARCSDLPLIAALLQAQEVPRDERGEPRRTAVPRLYRDWSPVAWGELLRTLPDETDDGEIEPTAEEDFGGRLAAALKRQIRLEVPDRRPQAGSQQPRPDRPELRSLLHWCTLFARAGPWRQIRSYDIWCRLEGDPRAVDRYACLRIAIRPELLRQLGLTDLAELGQRRLAERCEHYGYGARCRVGGPRGGRAIELDPVWLLDLLTGPADDLPGDAETGEATHTRVREECVTSSPEDISP